MFIKAAKSVLFYIAAAIILLLILSAVLVYTGMTESKRYILMMIILIVTALLAGIKSARGEHNQGWLRGITAGGIYSVILIIAGIAGKATGVVNTHILRNVFIVLLCSATGGIIGINMKIKKAR